MNFSLEIQEDKNVVVVTCKGYLNAEAGKAILSKVETALTKGKMRFVFDLSEAPLVSSVVLGDLIDIVSRTLTQPDLKICFCGLTNTVLTCFKSAGLNMYAEILPSREDALRSLMT